MSKDINFTPLFKAGKWIGAVLGPDDGIDHSHGRVGATGAPWLRQTFKLDAVPAEARLFISAPGWFELYVNGKPATKDVLTPVVTQLTARTSYICLDVTKLLRKGTNAVAALLGNGWFNCQTDGPWQLEEAPWRTKPPMMMELYAFPAKGEPQLLLASNVAWKAHLSQITANALRNGEKQDLRMDVGDPSLPDYDDSEWVQAQPINPPMGILAEQDCPGCVISDRLPPVESHYEDGNVTIYDFGQNLTGWCEFDAEGPAGSAVILEYGERKRQYGRLDRQEITFNKFGDFQTDRYTLDGKKHKGLHPHFTYHGFRFVQVATIGGAVIKNIKACFIHTDLKPNGSFKTSFQPLQWLQDVNTYTYLCNHTGIPTDCPHREKNGWTGDAALALETGLWNFHVEDSAAHFAQMLSDAQRPNGQLPCITPTGGWGFNWGCGPAWDTYVFEAAWQLWQFTGDISFALSHYDVMAKYLEYLHWQERDGDGIVYYGLGDWCPYNTQTMPPAALTSTGYYCEMADRMAVFAEQLRMGDDAQAYRELASHIRKGFVAKFMSKGDGSCGNNSITALGTALYFHLAPKEQEKKTLALLLKQLKASGYTADFGILGAKFVPRVLAENGCIDEIIEIFTQEKCPGWGFWKTVGATTFWETWTGRESQTHIMFGDPSACLFRHLGGIAPAKAGFAKISLTPAVNAAKLKDFTCTYSTPFGEVLSQLKTVGKKRTYSCKLPKGTTAELKLPGARRPVEITDDKLHSFDV